MPNSKGLRYGFLSIPWNNRRYCCHVTNWFCIRVVTPLPWTLLTVCSSRTRASEPSIVSDSLPSPTAVMAQVCGVWYMTNELFANVVLMWNRNWDCWNLWIGGIWLILVFVCWTGKGPAQPRHKHCQVHVGTVIRKNLAPFSSFSPNVRAIKI